MLPNRTNCDPDHDLFTDLSVPCGSTVTVYLQDNKFYNPTPVDVKGKCGPKCNGGLVPYEYRRRSLSQYQPGNKPPKNNPLCNTCGPFTFTVVCPCAPPPNPPSFRSGVPLAPPPVVAAMPPPIKVVQPPPAPPPRSVAML